MNIAFCLHTLNPASGGVASAVAELASALHLHGHRTTVISFDTPQSPWLSYGRTTTLALGPARSGYGYLPDLAQKLEPYKKSFDVIILNGLWLHSTAGFARWAHQNSVPYAVFPHGMLDPYFSRFWLKYIKKLIYWMAIERHTLAKAACVCFTTSSEQSLAQHTFPFFGPRRQAITSLPVQSAPDFEEPPAKTFARAFPHIADRPFILFLGRLHRKKAPHLILQALKKFPHAHLVIAGPPEEGAYYKYLQRLAGPIAWRVTFTGMLTGGTKWCALAGAQALILPSHQENFGMVVAEALSVGTPVLLSPQVALADVVKEYQAGFVGPAHLPGVEDLLWRLNKLSPSEHFALRQNALRCYAEHFHPRAVGQRFSQLLRSL